MNTGTLYYVYKDSKGRYLTIIAYTAKWMWLYYSELYTLNHYSVSHPLLFPMDLIFDIQQPSNSNFGLM